MKEDKIKEKKKENLLMTPRILEAIRSTSLESDGFLERMRTAVLLSTTEMAFSPAARMVSPDSGIFFELLDLHLWENIKHFF